MEKEKLGEDLFRVQTEINALKVLQHENISKLLQVIETEKNIYLILEVNIHQFVHQVCLGDRFSIYHIHFADR